MEKIVQTLYDIVWSLALVVIGGVKRIAKFASVVTPFMALGYIGISLVIIAMNWRVVPALQLTMSGPLVT